MNTQTGVAKAYTCYDKPVCVAKVFVYENSKKYFFYADVLLKTIQTLLKHFLYYNQKSKEINCRHQ